MSEPTISMLVADLTRAGLLLNNLFQLDNGKFRASVRRISDAKAFSFYDHPNPGAAVAGAIAQATYEPGVALRKNPMRVSRAVAAKISGDNLLQELGLL